MIEKVYGIRVNAPKLSWEIKQATGLNLGGYWHSGADTQNGSIKSSDDGITIVVLPDATTEETQLRITECVVAHSNDDSLPVDFPVNPTPLVKGSLKQKFAKLTTDSERIALLAEINGLL